MTEPSLLSPEQVAEIREVAPFYRSAASIAALCQSHEALRKALDEALRERDLARVENAQCWKLINGNADAALQAEVRELFAAARSPVSSSPTPND